MDVLNAVFYGLVQGLTEFLPVSSSGHLALYESLFGGPKQDPLLLSVLVHVASLVAVLVVFRREVRRLLFEDRRLGVYICIATLPAVAVGLGFHDAIEQLTGQPMAVGVLLMVTGLILVAGELVARGLERTDRTEQTMGLWRVLAVGVVQAAALLPGISRSGITISAGRSLGLTREASVRFAFLLAIPAIAGAGCYEGMKLLTGKVEMTLGAGPAAAGFLAALVSSYVALRLLIRLVRRWGLWVFAPYCFAAGAAALVYFGWR